MKKDNSPIGGYFGLELSNIHEYHSKAIALNTGRNALEYILIAKKYLKIYIPYFTCEVILEPLKKLDIPYEFYKIDENLEPIFDYSKIEVNHAFLYTNYFALKDKFIRNLSKKTRNLIIDNAQSFYSNPLQGIDTFYSPRKFFGVPDGAYLYSKTKVHQELEIDKSISKFSHLLKRVDDSLGEGYIDFMQNENSLKNNPIKIMSKLTSQLLASIDYEVIGNIRKMNMAYLHTYLSDRNDFKFNIDKVEVPLVYPLLIQNGNKLRQYLKKKKIFTAKYWPNVSNWVNDNTLEYYLTENIIALPIDQRYTKKDMNIILNVLKEY